MRASLLLLLFMPTMCLAVDGVPGIPSINEVPAFWGMTGSDPRYRDAAFKAQEAFFIQTGIASQYNLVTGYVNGQVSKVATTAERHTATFIDENTPLNSKHVFFAVAIGYTAIVKKEVTRSFRNPLWHGMTNTVTVGQKQQVLGIQIPF